jgi:hypothetical protein
MTYTVVAYDENGVEVTYGEAAELTRDILDEVYDPFTLGELSYPASRVLEEVDPIAFRQVVLEEIDYRIQDCDWTEDPPADEDEDSDDVAYIGLWHGGAGYSHGDWATDAEWFESLDHALEVFEARARNRSHLATPTHAVEYDLDGTPYKGHELDTLATPVVDDTATLTLARVYGATLYGLEADAEAVVEFGPDGSIRTTHL